MDEKRVVLLGTIQERQSVDDSSPYVCKAGGTPAWYSEPPLEADGLTCSKCNRDLFLLAQVYAPVETDRTLYVFGCNSVACTKNPGSWRVLRDQINTVKNTSTDAKAETRFKQVDPMKNGWGSDSDNSNWSDDEDDATAPDPTNDLVDLEMLLQQRNDAMKTKGATKKPNMALKKKEVEKESVLGGKRNVFPALLIEVIEEPFEDYKAKHDFAHENCLFEQYIKQEEEEKSADVGILRSVLTDTKMKGEEVQSSRVCQRESYEKTPAKQRHLLRFQERINRCPMQCLRYDYGGEPLWPVVIPQNLKVPFCSGCGEERLFEMQLTPAINYFLHVDQYILADDQRHTFESGTAVSDAPRAVAPLGGMDWLSLIVYSCSASCAQSREEFVYVVS